MMAVSCWVRLARVPLIVDRSESRRFSSGPRPPKAWAPVCTSVATSLLLTAPSSSTAESATNSSSGACLVRITTSPLLR